MFNSLLVILAQLISLVSLWVFPFRSKEGVFTFFCLAVINFLVGDGVFYWFSLIFTLFGFFYLSEFLRGKRDKSGLELFFIKNG